MSLLSPDELIRLRQDALNDQRPSERDAYRLVSAAKSATENDPVAQHSLQALIEAAEMDEELAGHLSAGITLNLSDALLSLHQKSRP